MSVPIMAPQAGSEFRPAAEAELLHPVVWFLAERECKSNRSGPNGDSQIIPTPTELRTCMALSTGHGTALGMPGPKVGQKLPEMTSPVAGNVVGPV
jgi:hypothetical protein